MQPLISTPGEQGAKPLDRLPAKPGEVTRTFLRSFKSGRERCRVPEVDGQMAGSIFVTDEGDGVCRLRLLQVEPACQGHGIGDALVATCLAFARSTPFARMTRWTPSTLTGARRLDARARISPSWTRRRTTFWARRRPARHGC